MKIGPQDGEHNRSENSHSCKGHFVHTTPITVTSNSNKKCKLHDTAQSMLTYSIRLLITPSINTVQKKNNGNPSINTVQKKTMVMVICGE
jgi:hypothetical protein